MIGALVINENITNNVATGRASAKYLLYRPGIGDLFVALLIYLMSFSRLISLFLIILPSFYLATARPFLYFADYILDLTTDLCAFLSLFHTSGDLFPWYHACDSCFYLVYLSFPMLFGVYLAIFWPIWWLIRVIIMLINSSSVVFYTFHPWYYSCILNISHWYHHIYTITSIYSIHIPHISPFISFITHISPHL